MIIRTMDNVALMLGHGDLDARLRQTLSTS
jgi:hypothetical protein